jgi:hypothetical protein
VNQSLLYLYSGHATDKSASPFNVAHSLRLSNGVSVLPENATNLRFET